MRRFFAIALAALVSLAACGEAAAFAEFSPNFEINVVSREAGSGTRGAFIELMGMQVDGRDMTNIRADIANGTNVVITSVANNLYAIGYITMASLNDNVRGMAINGVAPTAANVINGSYEIFRPFYIAVGDDANPLRDDFIDFIFSAEGQAIVAARYIPVGEDFPAFASGGLSGRVVVAGSTSVYPIMSRLAEAYNQLTGVVVEVHSMGSSAGINQAIDGTVDIGMSSRDLNEAELAQINAIAVAYDGLVIIVHPDNPIESLTTEKVRQIFVGEVTHWVDIMSEAPDMQQQALLDPDVQQQALLQARESEVAEMLMRVDFISSVAVGLALPPDNPFAAASVIIWATRPLTYEDGEMAALMVMRMVEGLLIENITVFDDELNPLFSGLDGG